MVKVENVRRGNSIFSVPRPRQRGPSDADASEYSMPHLPVFFSICTCVLLMIRSRRCEPVASNYRHLFYTDVVIWSYTLLKIYSLSPYSHTYYYWYSITHSLFHSRLKSFLFCKSSLPQPFLFLLQDSPYGFPRLFTVTSEHIRLFYFLVFFLFLHFLVVGSVR